MTVALYGLERSGSTLVGTFSFVVHSSAPRPSPKWLYHYLGESSWSPFAIDTVNLNRHDVMSGELGIPKSQTDSQGMTFLPGQTFYAFAVFAAPPEDVTTMDVSMCDGAPLAKNVAIR